MEKELQNIDINAFQTDLIGWYKKNKRQLPWRQDRNPYKIWVSEVMLQQTKVDTVIPYFKHFIEKYPTVYELSEADTQEVLKVWEGLGYYSRARNLQHAAQTVVEDYNGEIPQDAKALEKLKGIGPYTKGAILSIAFDKPEPAVDGNVMRVLSRILKVEEDVTAHRTRKLFEKFTYKLISHEDPSSFNQGLMELGALICTPKSPSCLLCPVQLHCKAFEEGVEELLPVRSKGKKQKELSYVALIIKSPNNKFMIEQRPERGLLASMWQFPMIPIDEIGFDHIESWLYGEYGLRVSLDKKKGEIRHIFTHLIWNIDIYTATVEKASLKEENIRFVSYKEMMEYPFPTSHVNIQKYIAKE